MITQRVTIGISLLLAISFNRAGAQTIEICDKAKLGANSLIESNEGWLLRSNPLRPTLDLSQGRRLDVNERRAITALARSFKRNGTDIVMVPIPQRGVLAHLSSNKFETLAIYDSAKALNSYQEFVRQVQILGFKAVDISKLDKVGLQNFALRRDHHWGSTGAKLSAESVVQILYPSNSTQAYTLQKTRDAVISGSVSQVLKDNCGTSQAPEMVEQFQAVSAEKQTDLFSDEELNVVFGTSNTASKEFSFVEFIKYFSGQDFVNLGLVGGNTFGSMEDWFSSKKLSMPDKAVWEFEYTVAANKDYPDYSFAVKGWEIAARLSAVCEDKPLQKRSENGFTILPFNKDKYSVTLLDINDKTLKSIDYTINDVVTGKLAKSLRLNNDDGKYYFVNTLPDMPISGDLKIKIKPELVEAYKCRFPEEILSNINVISDESIDLIDSSRESDFYTQNFSTLERGSNRWSLGKLSMISFSGIKNKLYKVNLSGALPMKGQKISVFINGKNISNFSKDSGAVFNLEQSFQSTGDDSVVILSNMSNSTDGFAPGDKRDLAVNFTKFNIILQNR
ncbi:hypothetical protein GCM10008959_38220 [Deinococcus seoulensis]|uniref:AlgX/AlgJ SGNH hydrolase-like domain-containing protein n=1 Tax=Deinococcus seoulensis TaxID=1837379 RepID=A0ABQ2RW47_9DEIO|nr:hypothetical protein [Deinococcus seoulensis]GGR73168.1 hypothetical protein GCM10008959_38220 [Deinococcus seoulensis]